MTFLDELRVECVQAYRDGDLTKAQALRAIVLGMEKEEAALNQYQQMAAAQQNSLMNQQNSLMNQHQNTFGSAQAGHPALTPWAPRRISWESMFPFPNLAKHAPATAEFIVATAKLLGCEVHAVYSPLSPRLLPRARPYDPPMVWCISHKEFGIAVQWMPDKLPTDEAMWQEKFSITADLIKEETEYRKKHPEASLPALVIKQPALGVSNQAQAAQFAGVTAMNAAATVVVDVP